jgi:hypothetical protein
LRRASDIKEEDGCFKAGGLIINPLAAYNHTGQILANGTVFGSDRTRADPHCKLRPEWESPSRPQNDSGIRYSEISVRAKTTIDPVVEINRELCALGIT